MNPPGKQCVP